MDTFLFSAQFTDLATFSVLSKHTAGSCYYYPGFHGPRDGVKFETELHHCLTRATGFEAVIRVRATKGLKISNFYGNHFIRGVDLLSLPNVTSDSVFGFDFTYEDPVLTTTAVTIQSALLYTSSNGERRIRVHTMVVPVTQNMTEFLESTDMACCANLMAKQAVELALKAGLETARQRVNQTTIDIMRSVRQSSSAMGSPGMPYGQYQQQQQQQPLSLPDALKLLPLYSMSLQKCLALRGGNDVRTDERAFFMQLLGNMSINDSRVFIYPRMFSIHDMQDDVGVPSDRAEETEQSVAGPNRVRLPDLQSLSSQFLSKTGISMLETGHDLFLRVGKETNPAIVATLFNYPSLDGVDMSEVKLHAENSDYSFRVGQVVEALRADRSRYMQLHIIREGDGYAEAFFARYLMEDRANFTGGTFSYDEFYQYVMRQVG